MSIRTLHSTNCYLSAALLATAILAGGCDGPAGVPQSGSETHFLVACEVAEDCASLGAGFTCDAGFCREVSTTSVADDSCPSGALSGADVLVIGDAYISLTALTDNLEEHARGAGNLASDDHFRDYASSSTPFLTGSLTIASQYAQGMSEHPARVIIMTGGAGDALQSCPDDSNEDCGLMETAATGAQALLDRMAQDGIEEIVYFFYPDPVDNADVKQHLDALRPRVEQICADSLTPCHFLDLRPVFAGNYDDYVGFDGLIFSPEGSRATADAIWQVMQRECVGQ